MKEQFTENFGNRSDISGENARFDVHSIHKSVPNGLPEDTIEAPGPQIGPGFLKEENPELNFKEKIDRKEAIEQEIDEIIIEAYEFIDLNNLKASYAKVIQELQEKNLYSADDFDMNRHIEITFGLVVNNIQNEERKFLGNKLSGGDGGFDREEKREAYDCFERMAISDAEWMHEIQKYINENRGKPEIISAFWKDFDKYYLILKKKFGNILEEDRNPERIKHGIEAEIAAKLLLEGLPDVLEEENVPGWEKVNISVSDATSLKDVRDKTDFEFILNGEVIPCQVKSCVIHPKEISVGNVEKEASRRKKYAEENSFTIVKTDSYFKETKENSGLWQERNIIKMEEFKEKAVKGKHERGCYFLFPVDMEDGEDLLREDGTVSEGVKKMFYKKIVKGFFGKDIYPDLDEKASHKRIKNPYKF